MIFDRRSAITTFYYLVASDGIISGVELQKFEELARQIDPEEFESYREEMIQSCEAQIGTVIDTDDYLDVVMEGVDKAIQNSSKDFDLRVPTRLVIWDMLVISYADSEYSENERKLIKHIVRLMEMDRSVFLEMESMIKTAEAVDQELEWLKSSDRPYNEIRPLVEETEKRQASIQKSAQALIEDEVLFLEKEVEEKTPTKFEETRDKVVDKTKEVAGTVGEKGKEVAGVVGEKGKEVAGVVGEKGKAAAVFIGGKGKEFADAAGKQSKKIIANITSKMRKKED